MNIRLNPEAIKNDDCNQPSRRAVQKAGEVLIDSTATKTQTDNALDILSQWRSCHIDALDLATDRLAKQARRICPTAIIAKRLKRSDSIIKKLMRFEKMKLRKMQDIGGCRAIVSTTKQAQKTARSIKQPSFRMKDYIKSPKEDGYRGIHLVGKFFSKRDGDYYDIEIQIRTEIQHAWATGVEIIDTFTNQSIKTNEGKPAWAEFFRVAAEEFARFDKHPPRPLNIDNIIVLEQLERQLDVKNKFVAFNESISIINKKYNTEYGYHLIIIDTRVKTLTIESFRDADASNAFQAYKNSEKNNIKNKNIVVALVSYDAIKGLREAYPNYFADSVKFLRLLDIALQEVRALRAGEKMIPWPLRIFSPSIKSLINAIVEPKIN